MKKVAALFVARNGCYWNLDEVQPWDEHRDARLYAGPFPVVAHPPCERWSILAHSVQAQYGYPICQDDGCFASALNSVETFGGVLEHPAYSMAWDWFGLTHPDKGKWIPTRKGWTCQVAQSAYGHSATKMTWLYYVGENPPPELNWSAPKGTHTVSCDSKQKRIRRELRGNLLPFLTHDQAKATPLPFRDLLISLAINSRK